MPTYDAPDHMSLCAAALAMDKVRRCTRDGQAAPPSDADRWPLPNTRAAAADPSTARTEGTAAAAPGRSDLDACLRPR